MENNQSGVSLITVFFLMTIILSIVLGLSVMLSNELENTRNSENSLIAFYLADSGVEKLLYFDRQKIPSVPEGIGSGICNIKNVCTDCQEINESTEDDVFCKSHQISYTTTVDPILKSGYYTEAKVAPNGNFFNMDISVKGYYKSITRAIGLQVARKDLSSSAPTISESEDLLYAKRALDQVSFLAKITDADGVDPNSVVAHVVDPSTGEDFDTVVLAVVVDGDPDIYIATKYVPNNYYYVYVRACDKLFPSNCGQSRKFPITSQ